MPLVSTALATLALVPFALAGDPLVSIGAEVVLAPGGGWARAFPEDVGWTLVWSAGGDYNALPMTADLVVDDRDRKHLTGRTDLKDHAIVRCPDGTFLHVGSANLHVDNDSAYAHRFDAEFNLLASGTVEEDNPNRQHNDPALICAPVGEAVAYMDKQGQASATLFDIAGNGTMTGTRAVDGAPRVMGGGLVWNADDDTFLIIGGAYDNALTLARYDIDLNLLDTQKLTALPAGWHAFWPQAVMRVGDFWILAHAGNDEAVHWDQGDGDIWVKVYDLDWNLIQDEQVTHNTAPIGGMRPGLARKNEQLLVTYDKSVHPVVIPLTLDLAALGVEGGDTGQWSDPADTDSDGSEDSAPDSGGDDDDDDDCGCATNVGAGWSLGGWSLAGMLLLPWWRRRKAS